MVLHTIMAQKRRKTTVGPPSFHCYSHKKLQNLFELCHVLGNLLVSDRIVLQVAVDELVVAGQVRAWA